MQGKCNMVLDYFIINIHMQLKRKEAGYNTSNSQSLQRNSRTKREVVAHEQGILGFFSFILTYIYTCIHVLGEEDATIRQGIFVDTCTRRRKGEGTVEFVELIHHEHTRKNTHTLKEKRNKLFGASFDSFHYDCDNFV